MWPASGEIEAPVVAGHVRLRERLEVRLRPRRLDVALAAGAPPEGDAALALRARRLTRLARRRSIAASLRRAVREAHDGVPRSFGRIGVTRAQVAAARAELTALADTLARPGPVAAQGVAEALILLTDGTGPLYNPGSHAILRSLAVSAARDLRPWDG